MPHPAPPKETPGALLSVRSAVVLLLGGLSGAAAALLTSVAGRHPAEAVLVGCATVAAAIRYFHGIIRR